MNIWIIYVVSKDYIDISSDAYKTYELALKELKKANLKRIDDYTFIDNETDYDATDYVYKIKCITVK